MEHDDLYMLDFYDVYPYIRISYNIKKYISKYVDNYER